MLSNILTSIGIYLNLRWPNLTFVLPTLGWFHLKITLDYDQNVGLQGPLKDTFFNDTVTYVKNVHSYNYHPNDNCPNYDGKYNRDGQYGAAKNNFPFPNDEVKQKIMAQYKEVFVIDKLMVTARGRVLIPSRPRSDPGSKGETKICSNDII